MLQPELKVWVDRVKALFDRSDIIRYGGPGANKIWREMRRFFEAEEGVRKDKPVTHLCEEISEAGLGGTTRDVVWAETNHAAASACVLMRRDHPAGHVTIALDRARHVDDSRQPELIRNLGECVAEVIGDDQVRLERLKVRPDVFLDLAKATEQRLLAREPDAKLQISERVGLASLIEVDYLCAKC